MRVLVLCVALSSLASACATAGPRTASVVPVAVALAGAPSPEPALDVADAAPGCEGVEIEMLVRDDGSTVGGGWSRRIALRCSARGATLTYEMSDRESEGSSETVELDPAEASALWAALRDVSLAALECGPSRGARSHRIEIAAARGVRIVECDAAETPEAWSALEAILTPARESDAEPWLFDAEHWRDELGYSRSTVSRSTVSRSDR